MVAAARLSIAAAHEHADACRGALKVAACTGDVYSARSWHASMPCVGLHELLWMQAHDGGRVGENRAKIR